MQKIKRSVGRPREPMVDKPAGKRALALREKGWSFTEIGAKLGLTKQRAHQIYLRVLREQREG